MTRKKTTIPPKRQATIANIGKALITLFLIVAGLHFAIAANHWRLLAPGVEYQDIASTHFTPWSHIHVFRVNLEQNKLSLVTAADMNRSFAPVKEFAQKSRAFIAINGGFFDKHYRPLGLRIRDAEQLNPLKAISWWAIFYTKHNRAYLSNVHDFKGTKQVNFAIQSGPRLLINGRIPSLKTGQDERSALGITRDGRLIILVTEHTALSTTELAKLMKSPPLNCLHALNLDGGSSSQLYANIKGFQLNVHGFSNVSDGIVLSPTYPQPTPNLLS